MFFRNLLKKMRGRQRMMNAGRMGSNFLPNIRKPGMMGMSPRRGFLPRVNKGIMGMMNPNMQFGLGTTPSMKARMLGLPDPVGMELPPQPGGSMPGMRSDIMPRDPGFGVNIPKRPPIMPGPIGMKDGGEAKQYPNAGLAALAEEAPEVVKRMGFAPGGEAISLFEIYQRLNRSMGSLSKDEMDLLKDLYSDGRYSAGDMMQKIKDFRSGTYMPRKFEDLETKTNRLSRTMGTGETARSSKPIGMRDKAGRMLERLAFGKIPNTPVNQFARAALAASPTMRQVGAIGGGLLRRLALPVTAGAGIVSLYNYLNELENPELETITLTQEEFDEMRRQAQQPEVIPVTLRNMD